jgi:peptide deformylase
MEENKEPIDFLKYLVPPHKTKSREVTNGDLGRVISDAKILYNLCFTQNGLYPGAYAMAHSQIDDKDPLRFFVTSDGKIVINPKITRRTNYYVDKEEACMTFPNTPKIIVQRFHKIDVILKSLTDKEDGPDFTEEMEVKLTGKDSQIFQHELDHLNGKYIYDEDHTPEDCLEEDVKKDGK